MTWAIEMETEMMTETTVRDVTTAAMLRKRHDELRAEMDARDDSLMAVVETGNAFVAAAHFAKNDVRPLFYFYANNYEWSSEIAG